MNNTKTKQRAKAEVLRELADMPVVVNKEVIEAKLLELTEEIDQSWEDHEEENWAEDYWSEEMENRRADRQDAKEIGEDAVNYLRAIEDFNGS